MQTMQTKFTSKAQLLREIQIGQDVYLENHVIPNRSRATTVFSVNSSFFTTVGNTEKEKECWIMNSDGAKFYGLTFEPDFERVQIWTKKDSKPFLTIHFNPGYIAGKKGAVKTQEEPKALEPTPEVKPTMWQARTNAILNTKIQYSEGVMNRREYLEMKKKAGSYVEAGQRPAVEFNRTKYNRMTGREQDAYEKRCNEMVPSYGLHTPGTSVFIELCKIEYDYFNSLPEPQKTEPTKPSIDLRKPAPQLDIFRPTQIPLF
jgi:hypothetical protein